MQNNRLALFKACTYGCWTKTCTAFWICDRRSKNAGPWPGPPSCLIMCPHPPPPRAPSCTKMWGPFSCTKNAGPWAGLLSCTKMWDPGRRRWCRTSSINCIIVRTRFQSSGYRTLIFGFLLHVCSVRDKGNVFSSGTTWRKSLNRLF